MQRLAEATGAPLAATGAYAGESKEERQERMEREASRGDLRKERYRARLLQVQEGSAALNQKKGKELSVNPLIDG